LDKPLEQSHQSPIAEWRGFKYFAGFVLFSIPIRQKRSRSVSMVGDLEFGEYVSDVLVLYEADLLKGLGDPDAKHVSNFSKIFHLKAFVNVGFELWNPSSSKDQIVNMGKEKERLSFI
jgi:hypothetical protein